MLEGSNGAALYRPIFGFSLELEIISRTARGAFREKTGIRGQLGDLPRYLCHFGRKNPLAHALPEFYIACSHRSGVSTFGTEIPELELPGEKEIRVGTEAAKRGRL
jgi:hypothetical protein